MVNSKRFVHAREFSDSEWARVLAAVRSAASDTQGIRALREEWGLSLQGAKEVLEAVRGYGRVAVDETMVTRELGLLSEQLETDAESVEGDGGERTDRDPGGG